MYNAMVPILLSTGDDWKRGTGKHETILQSDARLENAGPSYRWVENARPVAMERWWYQCCKTEIDVVVRCQKHTRTGNIVYAVINSYRKKYTLPTQSELKSLRKVRMHQKSAKNTILWKLQMHCILFHTKLLPMYTKLIVTHTQSPSENDQVVQCKKSPSTQRNVKVKKDAGSSECLCIRWDNHDPDVPLRLRTDHRTAGGHMAQVRYADRGVDEADLAWGRCCQWLGWWRSRRRRLCWRHYHQPNLLRSFCFWKL